MPSINCGLAVSTQWPSCVKNITLPTVWLWFLLLLVVFNDYLTQFVDGLCTLLKAVFPSYFGWLIHTKHSPNNKYNLII